MSKPILVDGLPVNYADLPDHLQDGMKRYLEGRIEPGSFLRDVLQNNLSGAVFRCGEIGELRAIMLWLHNYAPPTAHGGPHQYLEWLS